MILVLRTDKPEAELGLYDGQEQIAYQTWQAHRQLAETIHIKIRDLLKQHKHDLVDITGIVVYQGPGSFTGLRIGMSVANALAYSLDIPVAVGPGDEWIEKGISILLAAPSKRPVVPDYGAHVHTTKPRK
jgi:tRNA threonylcarbamoyladenosine biosynthesis protein TsaB